MVESSKQLFRGRIWKKDMEEGCCEGSLEEAVDVDSVLGSGAACGEDVGKQRTRSWLSIGSLSADIPC